MALGGLLGGLANLGTIYGGYQQGQQLELQNQQRQQALQNAQQQQDALTLLGQGLQNLPNTPAVPGATSPTFGGNQPLGTPVGVPTIPASPAPAPFSPLQTAAAGPVGQPGLPGGGPLGMPGLPGQSGFGGGQPQLTGADAIFGPGTSAFSPNPSPPSGAPQQTASLEGVPGATKGLGQYDPLPDYTIPQVAQANYPMPQSQPGGMTGPPEGWGPIDVGTSTLSPRPGTPPQMNGLGGSQQAPSQIPAGGPGIVQPPGSFGLPRGFTPAQPQQQPAAPQTAAPGTAQVPGTADTGQPPVSGGVAAQITQILKQRGWSDAAIQGALANGMAESGLKPWGETGAAGEQGIWQFNPRGELPGYQKAYGTSRSVADQTNYMAGQVEASMPGYSKLTSATAATDQFMSGFEKPSKAAPGSRYRFLGQVGGPNVDAQHRALDTDVDQSGHALIRSGQASGPTVQDSSKTAMLAGRMIDPSQWGMASLKQAVAAIEKANPDAPPAVKALAVMQLYKLLAPEDKMQAQYLMQENRLEFQRELQNQRLADQDWRTQFSAGVREDIAAASQAGQDRRLAQREDAINKRQAASFTEREKLFNARIQQTSGKLNPQETAQLRQLKAQQIAMNNQAARYGGWIAAPDELKTARDTVDEQIDELLSGAEKRVGATPAKPLKETPMAPPPPAQEGDSPGASAPIPPR